MPAFVPLGLSGLVLRAFKVYKKAKEELLYHMNPHAARIIKELADMRTEAGDQFVQRIVPQIDKLKKRACSGFPGESRIIQEIREARQKLDQIYASGKA